MDNPIILTIESYKNKNYTFVLPSDTDIDMYREEALYDNNQNKKLICIKIKAKNTDKGIQEISTELDIKGKEDKVD